MNGNIYSMQLTALFRSGSLFLLFLIIAGALPAQRSVIDEEIQLAKNQQVPFQEVSLFQADGKRQLSGEEQRQVNDFAAYTLLLPDLSAAATLKAKAPEAISMNLPDPSGEGVLELELVRFNILSGDFQVREMPSGRILTDFETGVYYRGVIKGEEGSLVSIGIAGDEISGLISRVKSSDNLVLGKLKSSPRHILYNDRDVQFATDFDCGALPSDASTDKEDDSNYAKVDGCFGIYFDIGNSLVNSKGGSNGALTYVQNVFAQVAILYANEEISITMSGTDIWTSPEPGNWLSSIANYRSYRNSNPRDGSLVHYIHSAQTSGVAYVNGLCGSYRYGISGVQNSYNDVPTYSWTVEVVTHELGHNFGSPHTHDCAWNGNNTAIDGCGPAAGYDSGCNGPLPNQGGTIMSYCHLTSVGINFNLGFGTQPGDLVRLRASQASCSNYDCGNNPPAPTCTDGIQNGNETGVDCGGPDCAPCDPGDCTEVTVTINLDNYPEETSWNITNSGGSIVATGGTYGSQPDGSTVTVVQCLPEGCYDFNIFDAYGDGICCGYGNGSYSVTADGNTLASGGQFGSSETTNFCLGGGPAPTCNDGEQNGNETGVDCGGPDCDPCATCNDGEQNGNETGVDCGGPDCDPCATCNDGEQNGNETSVDCGGPDCDPCDPGECATETINSTSFDTWGIWNDGGSDCRRSANDAAYAYTGSRCVRLRDDTNTSVATTDDLDLSGYEEITVDWAYYPRSMENGEDYWLQISTNGGSSYTTVATYARGVEFENNAFYFSSVTISGPFTADTRVRFRCDASGNGDYIYIDDVVITGCKTASGHSAIILTENTSNSSSEPAAESGVSFDEAEDETKLIVYPNPSRGDLTASFNLAEELANDAQLQIVDLTGRMIGQYNVQKIEGQQNLQIDLSSESPGVYFIRLTTGEKQYIQRFVLQK